MLCLCLVGTSNPTQTRALSVRHDTADTRVEHDVFFLAFTVDTWIFASLWVRSSVGEKETWLGSVVAGAAFGAKGEMLHRFRGCNVDGVARGEQ